MVIQWELITLDNLKSSCFGCPRPRHGLQLLFWFANECILHDDNQGQGVVIELAAECQPERGDFGFHPFWKIEKTLLRGRCKKKKKGAYFEVGNLNTQTYPAADNLPDYVKENHGLRRLRRNNNVDRIIICYDTGTKIVDMVYVTEHDTAVSGKFSPERTHMISPELIRTLQDTQLDVFLILAGYYNNLGHGGIIVHQQQPSAVPYIGSDYIYGSSIQSQQTDNFYYAALSEYNQQIANSNIRPDDYIRSPAAIMGTRGFAGTTGFSWGFSARERGSERGSEDDDKKWRKRAMVLGKVLLAAGALYLGAKCFSWLSGGGGAGKHLHSTSVRTVFHDTPIMLSYVF